MSRQPQGQSQEKHGFAAGVLGTTVILGATGFLAGFLIPVWRTPYANQGPLLGIFITGPLCTAIGIVLGLLGNSLKLSQRTRLTMLLVSCALTFVVVYSICEPEDRWECDLVYGTVTKCIKASSFQGEVEANWERSIAINKQKKVLNSWKADVGRSLTEAAGHVAILHVERRRSIYEGRHTSNKGQTYATPWNVKSESVKYFLEGDVCLQNSNRPPVTYLADWPEWPEHERFPPDDAARLLSVAVLRTVPAKYKQWESQ